MAISSLSLHCPLGISSLSYSSPSSSSSSSSISFSLSQPSTSSEVLHLRIPKVPSFRGCAAVVGIFSGVEDGPGRIRARQKKKVGNKLRRGKLVAAVADDDGAADSNGASSGDGEDAAPTAPDRESIVSLLSLSVRLCLCPFPFLQTLNPNSGHFLDTKSAAFNWRLVSDCQYPHVFLEIAEEEEEEEKLWMLLQKSSLPMPPL